jgi:hypothetical protein
MDRKPSATGEARAAAALRGRDQDAVASLVDIGEAWSGHWVKRGSANTILALAGEPDLLGCFPSTRCRLGSARYLALCLRGA